ncbi:hypothetical protein GCM10007937_46650 [Mesorhizobium albiziae]|nr:hypothetical protein GCM10007937_46650 [Mesorhizobium albiziae]
MEAAQLVGKGIGAGFEYAGAIGLGIGASSGSRQKQRNCSHDAECRYSTQEAVPHRATMTENRIFANWKRIGDEVNAIFHRLLNIDVYVYVIYFSGDVELATE